MIKKYCFLFVMILLLISCGKESTSYPKGIWFPNHTKFILQINKKSDFLKATDTNIFWQNYMSDLPNGSVKKLLSSLPDSLTYWVTYTTDNQTYIISSESSQTLPFTKWKSDPDEYFEKKIDSNQWYCKKIGNRFIFSEKKNLDNFFEEQIAPLPSSIEKLNSTIDTKVIANLFIEKFSSEKLFHTVFHRNITQEIGDWIAIDISLNKTSVQLNGASVLEKNSKLKEDTLTPKWKDAVPAFVSGIASYKVTDDYDKPFPDFAQFIYGINVVSYQQNKIVILNSTDIDATINKLPIASEYSLNDKTIYELSSETNDIESFLASFDINFIPCLITKYNGHLVISEDENPLVSYLNALQGNYTLSETKPFYSLKKQMSTTADQTFITSFNDSITLKNNPNISQKYALASLQISSTGNLSTFNFVTEESSDIISMQGPKQIFQLTIEDSIISSPKIVKNHNTNKEEIIFQNAKNELILTGNKGEILFKKPLDTIINSPIYQVDLFRNKKLQYAFSTLHSIWVIDRNGNEVAPFPKKYKGNLSPLEIISYGKNYDYRFATVEDSLYIHLIDNHGKKVTGFIPPKLESKILQTPKHFIMKSKDYLVFPTEKEGIKILHRNGRIRIPVTEKFNFSKDPIILSDEHFYFSTTEGKIISINSLGNVKYDTDSLGFNHHFATSKNLKVYVTGNTLRINNKDIELPTGNYQSPKIHEINSSVLVSIFDKKNKKIYLYDQKGNLIPHFPMTSFSDVDINLSSEGKTIMVIAPEANTIILFELN